MQDRELMIRLKEDAEWWRDNGDWDMDATLGDDLEEASERIDHLSAEKSKAVKDLEELMRQLPGQVCSICIKQGTEECNWGQHLYHYCTPKWRGINGDH